MKRLGRDAAERAPDAYSAGKRDAVDRPVDEQVYRRDLLA
jgi:hypothetical protein